eukprot:2068050-Amphidinium_carterae.2
MVVAANLSGPKWIGYSDQNIVWFMKAYSSAIVVESTVSCVGHDASCVLAEPRRSLGRIASRVIRIVRRIRVGLKSQLASKAPGIESLRRGEAIAEAKRENE